MVLNLLLVRVGGRQTRWGRQGRSSGVVPAPRPCRSSCMGDDVSHVVTRPVRLDHLRAVDRLNAVGPLMFRWTTWKVILGVSWVISGRRYDDGPPPWGIMGV